MANIKCIDVSTWQGTIDWKKVKDAGYGHAILRAGYGRETTQKDAQFEANYKNAKKAGVKLGVYWYSYADDVASAKLEAAACLAVLKGKIFEMPVFFDMEESKQTALGKSTLTSMAKAFCEAIKKGGYRPGVYSNLSWLRNYLDYDALRKLYPIWLAQYYTSPSLECDVWQYSSEGSVSGISGNVDMNIIYNEDIIKSTSATPPTTPATIAGTELKSGNKGLDILCLKYLIQIADDMGILDYGMTLGNTSFSSGTEKAVKELQKTMSMPETGIADAEFVNKLYLKIKDSYPVVGDLNGDGKVTITDATAIQKNIAGLE